MIQNPYFVHALSVQDFPLNKVLPEDTVGESMRRVVLSDSMTKAGWVMCLSCSRCVSLLRSDALEDIANSAW